MQPGSVGRRATASGLTGVGLTTFVALYLVWAAFHDIAHGESDLTMEYAVLAISAAWLSFVAVYLIRTSHRALGAASLVALVAGLWGQRGIGPEGTAGPSATFLATAGAYLWFVSLAGILVAVAWRTNQTKQRDSEP